MLLQQIVALFDVELERLERLREIIAGLGGPSVLEVQVPAASLTTTPDALPAAPEPPSAPARPTAVRIAAKERKAPVRRTKPAPEPNALSGTIPRAPVVVSAAARAAQTARTERAREERAAPPAEPGSLGSMIRALRLGATS